MEKGRLCIYPKDISLITGRGIRSSQKMLREIKVKLRKKQHQYVTVEEFADYSGISIQLLKNRR